MRRVKGWRRRKRVWVCGLMHANEEYLWAEDGNLVR